MHSIELKKKVKLEEEKRTCERKTKSIEQKLLHIESLRPALMRRKEKQNQYIH